MIGRSRRQTRNCRNGGANTMQLAVEAGWRRAMAGHAPVFGAVA
ncbi:hypothetical protein BSIN_1863 [Burkholderia singularis]|uniref:Uncharacterized protein n=1 Tax=Burkholderia singularis TaxID=1503053 RepID=A0A238H036_9BURK|nr:hypothetical protein BSIN_1863 [Burkholderia singularis]